MSPVLALAVVTVLLVAAVAVGLVLRRREGARRRAGVPRFDPADAAAPLGQRATLVQFSTDLCAKCPQVRRLLGSYAAEQDGLRHVEIDLTTRPDLASRYRVLQTPTTLVVDRSGDVIARFHGVPQRHALNDAVAAA
ncbi:thioredoxin family protein [Microbacterium paraoxydans]|uniref:Thioredoxin family protein n=1 Tax=Microbacterium paraoxydans TaxID=199592 RepID=A0ABS5IQA5_9MICO|nr:thioredoxin family protein [Microbacterium paraoxydans]MBS0025147.1 thioredoxin family protein [Microbacterium paraoxydans]